MGEKERFWVGFSLVQGIGPVRLHALLKRFGDVESAWNASAAELEPLGIPRTAIQALVRARSSLNLEQELEKIKAGGFGLLTWEDDDYPVRLREIDYSPPVLYVWGSIQEADRLAVAIVGTRRATAYGRAVGRDIAAELAASGVTVISGLARGIDGIAHKAALDVGGRTIAVLGSGLDHLYPPQHRTMASQVAGSGAVISDYPLGTRPEGGNFPPRNRIISGLALAVIVIEAGARSGALITADFAAEQGREVFSVPGNITSPASQGTNRLIHSGAHPLLKVDQVLEALNLELAARKEAISEPMPEDETERKVLQVLSADPMHIDEVRARCNLPIAQITATMALLELRGQVRQVGGMHYVRSRESRAPYRVE